MNLYYYAMQQRTLDSHLSRPPSEDDLVLAIVAELGELANEFKYSEDYGWAWWPRAGRRFDREALLGELIDVLHFVLVGYNLVNDTPKIYHQAMIDEIESLVMLGDGFNLSEKPGVIIRSAEMGRYHDCVGAWYNLARSLGFDDEEIDRGFSASVAKNLSRWGT
ncbi:MAG: dUTP diphosphatase [Actinobacteria bacterium]|nr:dUTP diphosphatase [Actinomycetota bacterium]